MIKVVNSQDVEFKQPPLLAYLYLIFVSVLVPLESLQLEASAGKQINKALECWRDVGVCLRAIQDDNAQAIYKQCSAKLCQHIKLVVQELSKEFASISTYVAKTLNLVMNEHKIADGLKAESFESAVVGSICADSRLQNLLVIFAFGKDGLDAACSLLKQLTAFCKSSDDAVFLQAGQWTDSCHTDMHKFVHAGLDNTSGLCYVGYIVGTTTLAQSMVRDLKTGETRQTLVHRALQGVRKRGFQCHAGFVKKCEAIASGKPLAGK